MATVEQVQQSLDRILVPGAKRSLSGLNLVRDVSVADRTVSIKLARTALSSASQDWLKARTAEEVGSLPDTRRVDIEYTDTPLAELNEIDRIFAIMSGKGGVGKSLVASLTAVALRRLGFQAGILDADITGPSIPRMFGATDRPAGSDTGILPVLSRSGISLMSINLLLPDEDEAVVWRGPLIGRTVKQFGEEVLWGKLDYLIIDLPPGTADAPLTVMQSFPISGIIIVFTPQDLVEMIVKKAVRMAQKMERRVAGVIENMAYLYVPEIDKRIDLFGKSRGKELAKAVKAPLLGQIPVDPQLAALCDAGEIERYQAEFVDDLGRSVNNIK